ncbi:molybdopterin/thiamine biosynthesis adenylyltransferase [Sphingomonas sp. SORGH_AS870]|uniref:HesA/MoeB/ThiF family protein n=1 Tax=Sphingomonas sp. SORGH_AS_0870 TaxID=3041801 RepID=UPI002855FE61|nr:molybdopterin-synthase adenylyltransferase MoeB [Sphingomonas sp. SORGH_AS_0870]MDR6145713.1 molybdopterin/thiamine biosynthesis adenylyltransferase [Sphingomonas sp. SORGH_AS_0870]
MILTDDELARYARHIVLREFGGGGQLRLKQARVAVIGAGGIGSPAIQYLAAAGVGSLVLIDDDVVEPSNLQRQTIFTTEDRGTPKVEAAARFARRLNPHVAVDTHRARVMPDTVLSLIDGADVVLDGCDNFATRLTVADAALSRRIPLVSAAVGQFEGQLATYRGWEADKPCYRCFVGDAVDQAGLTCADDGVLGPVTGIMGSLAALEVLRAIAPFGRDSAGSVLIADLLSLRFRTLALPKDPGCRCAGVAAAA